MLCGLSGIHVDDILCFGSGEHFEERIQILRNSLPFGSWKSLSEPATFGACEIRQREDGTIEPNQERYAEGIMEVPLTRDRREALEKPLSEDETKQFRAALGALSWRATQSAPWLAASVSFLQGCHKSAKVGDLVQAKKLIRMQKNYSHRTLVLPTNISKPIFLTYHDASWACRRDGSSQGGVFTMLVDQEVLQGKPCSYAPTAWLSRKLPRVCRSSTSAEIQTGSHAMDAHEFTKQTLFEWYNERAWKPTMWTEP